MVITVNNTSKNLTSDKRKFMDGRRIINAYTENCTVTIMCMYAQKRALHHGDTHFFI